MKGKKQIWAPTAALPPNTTLPDKELKNFGEKVKEINKVDVSLQSKPQGGPGVIYVGNIPHGFFERQLKDFFKQFGQITRLRLSRSKKTAGSRGYAFVEFEHQEVARIVAETMNNYLLLEKLLKCQYLPPSKVHPKTFERGTSRFLASASHIRATKLHNRSKSKEEFLKNNSRILASKQKTIKKLADLGIDYQLPGLANQIESNRQKRKSINKKRKAESAESESPDLSPEKDSESLTSVSVKKRKQSRSGKKEPFCLLEDSTDDEIGFVTPPNTVKSTRLNNPLTVGSVGRKTPLSRKKVSLGGEEKKSKRLTISGRPKLETKLKVKSTQQRKPSNVKRKSM